MGTKDGTRANSSVGDEVGTIRLLERPTGVVPGG